MFCEEEGKIARAMSPDPRLFVPKGTKRGRPDLRRFSGVRSESVAILSALSIYGSNSALLSRLQRDVATVAASEWRVIQIERRIGTSVTL